MNKYYITTEAPTGYHMPQTIVLSSDDYKVDDIRGADGVEVYLADEADYRIAELEAKVQRLEAERVSDDLLEALMLEVEVTDKVMSEYKQDICDEALAILEKRDKG